MSPLKKEIGWSLAFIMFCCLVLSGGPVHSEEEGEGESEGGGGGHSGGSSASAPPEMARRDEYLDLSSSIEQLNAKIRSKNEDLKKLLLEKDQIKDPTEFKEIVKKIQTAYSEIKEVIENVEKKKAVLKYRFPERSFVKKNESAEIKGLEEVSVEAAIEKRVRELLEIVEDQYKQPIFPASVRKLKERNPASESKQNPAAVEESNPEDFTRSLILKK